MIEEIEIHPVITKQQDLDAIENKFPDQQPRRIFTDSVKITCGGKLKALFLKPKDNKAPIPESHYKPALKVLDAPWKMFPWRPSKDNGRPMVKQRRVGGDLVFWYLKPRSGREDYFHAPTRDVLPYAMTLTPLVADMQKAIREHLPGYYQFHMWQESKLVLPPEEVFVQNPWKVDEFQQQQLGKLAMSGWGLIPGANAFSTLTLNKTLLFGAHDDGSNMPYTFSCITALGDFVGGYLTFPRLGIGFDVQPYDVLISDTNYEHHCSGRIVVGSRYTIVAYLQKKIDRGYRLGKLKNDATVVLEKDRSRESWRDSIEWWMKRMSHVYSPVSFPDWESQSKLRTISKPIKKPLPFEYAPNFLSKEEANELAAYFDTLKFDIRMTKWKKEIKRQSLEYKAGNAFIDRKDWGTEFADIETMPEILQRFRRKLAQHAGREINYISILKYPSSDATIDWHNHREDHWHNSPVWDITIGPTERWFWAREIANPRNTVTSVLAEVGSLVTLPASMNTTHQHAILKDKSTGVRYSINCKSLPLYAVWECRSGKNYPKKGFNFHEDAVYVGCRVCDRQGNVIREGTIFGNGTNPLVSHNGGLKTEGEFRQYAERKMQDPAFQAEVEKLRGKHLLCWCVQSGPKRAEFCHARVWLEIANRDGKS